MREAIYRVPRALTTPGLEPPEHRETVPAGGYNDLWRCGECGELWRVGSSCDSGPHDGPCPRGGYHPSGYKWRPATLWQRICNRRRR